MAISAVSCEAEEEPVNHLNSEVLAVNSLVTSNDPSGDVLSSDEEGKSMYKYGWQTNKWSHTLTVGIKAE